MSGSIDANQIRTGNFLDALAHPTVVNPLAAYSSAADAANKVWGIRKWQAEQAAGEAQQAGIDTSGMYQPSTAAAALKAAGPRAALAAGPTLESSQRLGTAQTAQGIAIGGIISSELAPLINLPDDQIHDGVAAAAARIIARGVPAAQVLGGMARLSSDPAVLRQQLELLRQGHLPPEQQQGEIYGTRPTIDTPGAVHMPVVPPVRTGVSVTTPKGPPPGQVTPSFEPYDDQGQIPRDANGNPSRTPKFWQPSTVAVTAVPGVPTGGPPQLTDQAGRPLPPTLLKNPNALPGTPPGRNAPVAPPPAVTPASPASAAPQAATPAPVGPAAATPAPAATPPAAVPAAKPPVVTAPPQGQPEKLKADVETYTKDQAAYPDVQTRAQNMAHAYEALSALKSATGKGAGGINDLRSYAQTLGLLPPGAVNEQKLYEIVNKYTERAMIDAAGGSSTDMGRRMQEQANAGTLLSTPANLEILRNDMGKTLQTMAAYKDHKDTSGAGYLEGRAKLADATDPRGFVWNLYSPQEQAKINAEVGEKGPAADKLHKAIGMAGRLNLQIPGLVTQPQKQSMAVPSQPSGNLLAMAGAAPGNALAA